MATARKRSSRSAPARKSAQPNQDTRTRLLESATAVFAEVGYRRATTREICARAGANSALINYHFGGKLALYSQVLQNLVSAARITAVRAALNQDAPPEKLLRDAIKARLRGAATGDHAGWLFRILAHEMAQPSPAMTRIIERVLRPLYRQTCAVVANLLVLSPEDEETRLSANSVLGQVILYVLAGPVLKRLWPEMNMTPEHLDRIAGHITDFSMAYLKSSRRRRE